MTAIELSADVGTLSAADQGPSKSSVFFVLFCLLCALPLLNDEAVSWVAKGTGAQGVFVYVAAWSAVASLSAIALGALSLTGMACWLLRDAVVGLIQRR